ncbi:hypothetical protein BD770DRAFT_440956 [Pilaira anomala]|nr:hypothetical protein BD770DRAFT_440956 [Pilaira anomala]
MNRLLTLSVTALLIASISAAHTPNAHSRISKAPIKKLILPIESQCTPGLTFTADDGCNTCTCPCSGLISDAICTEKACCVSYDDICLSDVYFQPVGETNFCQCPPSGLKSETTYCQAPPTSFPYQGDTCIPGTTYETSPGSFTFCECPLNGLQQDATVCFAADFLPIPCDICTPGAKFNREDGSKCTCPASGLKSETTYCDFITPTDCTPGTSFLSDDGLNTCTCPISGYKSEAVCTPTTCETKHIKKRRSHHRCEPGSSFLASDGCNTCYCPANGVKKEAGCTKMACSN